MVDFLIYLAGLSALFFSLSMFLGWHITLTALGIGSWGSVLSYLL